MVAGHQSLSELEKPIHSHPCLHTYSKGSIDLPLMTVSTGEEIMAVAFSSDGMQIVSGLNDGSVQVWDASTGVELKELKGHTKLSQFSCIFE
jgi:WD40 repeat protein